MNTNLKELACTLSRLETSEFKALDVQHWVAQNADSIVKQLSGRIANMGYKFGLDLSPSDFIADCYIVLPEILRGALDRNGDKIDPAERQRYLLGTSVSYMRGHLYTALRSDGTDTNSMAPQLVSFEEVSIGDTVSIVDETHHASAQLLGSEPVDHSETSNFLHGLIENLDDFTEEAREILRLRAIEGYSALQIADTLGISHKRADQKVFRVRKRLADAVMESNPELAEYIEQQRFLRPRS